METNRRDFFTRLSWAGLGLFAGREIAAGQTPPRTGPTPDHDMSHMDHAQHQHPAPSASAPLSRLSPGSVAAGSAPVVTPDIPDLPFKIENGVKVFHLVAEPVKQEIVPGRVFDLWGFNGSAPGPTIQANQGDRVRIIFENHLPEPTAIHWHGLEIPIEMDGVPGIGQKPVMPGARFIYEFTLDQEGTYFYHSHMAMQEMIGMLGAFILHPKTPYTPRVDKDFALLLQEYAVLPNNTVPNTMSMEYNWLSFNGKASPAATPLIIKLGERVRVRLVNLGMDHHPVHLHGFTFWETGREGARQPEALWSRGNTALVGVAQARDIEFVANRPGDWMLHCHLPHHMMNQMASNVGPMTRLGIGIQAGAGMEEGMGMLRNGSATSENNGPSLGRGLGVGSASDQAMSNGPLSQSAAMAGMQHMHHEGMPGMDHSRMYDLPKDANRVPGFPQDAYMESPMMAMDKAVEKPETHGLPEGWSGFMGGMMTLVRVLPPDKYAEIMKLKEKRS
jgi:manganese oxidase